MKIIRFRTHSLCATAVIALLSLSPLLPPLTPQLRAQVLVIGAENCPINDPFAKTPLDPRKWTIVNTDLVKRSIQRGSIVTERRKLADVLKIMWPNPPPQIQEANVAVQRGDASKALTTIEPVLVFFAKMKKNVPGSHWLAAASIKLDALVLLKNDVVLSSFIRELEGVNAALVPGLADRIKLAKLDQLLRRGDISQVLADTKTLINETIAPETLAQLHIIRGDALLHERRHEEALRAFLSVTIFYGNNPKYIPTAYIGAVKAFRALNTPSNKHLQLENVANSYLNEIIARYPHSKEAQIARGMLPKDDRENLDKKDARGLETAQAIGTGAAEEETETAVATPPSDTGSEPATPTPTPAADADKDAPADADKKPVAGKKPAAPAPAPPPQPDAL
ncbi:MAG: hypothetical protein LBS59_05325 [Puniceicoccales bacterium]|jgi:hypothetical protein|nr:hypothetical protein [Puniceicoccales bacterium]